MSRTAESELWPLVARLHRRHALLDDERAALACLPLHVASVAPEQDFVVEGEPADTCAVLLDGMACGYKLTGDGRRQIVGLHLTGDLPDLHRLHLATSDVAVSAAGRCRVGSVPLHALRDLCALHPRLAAALWRDVQIQGAISREWLLNVGRRDARTRLAHLLCEIVVRQHDAGLSSNRSCDLPLTQQTLADIVGLSAVHLNRVIQELRGEGLIAWERRRLDVLDWGRLRALADFDPAYLQGARRPLPR